MPRIVNYSELLEVLALVFSMDGVCFMIRSGMSLRIITEGAVARLFIADPDFLTPEARQTLRDALIMFYYLGDKIIDRDR